jgi:SulP family sulfate permease
MLVALGALFIKRSWPRVKNLLRITVTIPASFIAIIVTTTLAELLNLDIARIGEIPTNLFSNLNFQVGSIPITSLIYGVLAVALLGAIESLLSARVADAMAHKEIGEFAHHEPNRELFGQGLATTLSSISGGMPATGAIARTTVNVHAGARSRFAAVIHSLFLVVVVFLLAPIVALIPTAALAGVLLGTSIRIANPVSVKEALSTTNDFRVVYLITAASVLAIDLIWGVLIGILIDRGIKLTKTARERRAQ